MIWTTVIGFCLVLLFGTGIVCTILYCWAMYKYIKEHGLGDDDDDWGL